MTARPTLLILSFSPIASDARVLKQVRVLAQDHDVTTCGYGPAVVLDDGRVVEHLRVDDANEHWRKAPVPLLARQYRRVYWGNAAVAQARDLLAGRTFDVVLADDVDAVPLALSTEPRWGVHADLHEYAPKQNTELRRWRWFVAPYMRWLCRRFVTRCASVTTVAQGIADEYERRFGFRAGVVTNASPYQDLTPGPVASPVRLVHSGVALRNRSLEILVDAVASSTADVTLDLFLVPNDPGYLAELREHAAFEPRVRIHDPLPYAELVTTLNGFDVGLHLLPPVSFNNANALPNKVFDYVQARLGLIVGPSPEMARVVREHGVGAVTADFTPAALTAVLDTLTAEKVEAWKAASHASARELSSESQVEIWREAIGALHA